jgi:four helix bundle protein
MQNYKDLTVWKNAHELVLYVYKLTVAYPRVEQFSLTSQLRRAAISIPTNIAEGCGKYTQSDFANYLQTALGSSNEVEYLAYLSHQLGYMKDDTFQSFELQINSIKAMLISLISKVRRTR